MLMPVAVGFDIYFWIEAWLKCSHSIAPTLIQPLLFNALGYFRNLRLPGLSVATRFRMPEGPSIMLGDFVVQ